MNSNNDIYSIAGRVKNYIAAEDIALSSAGTILVNTFSLFLNDLYNFSETLPSPYNKQLFDILRNKEDLPKYIIKMSTSKEGVVTLYDEFLKLQPKFQSTEAALEHLTMEYESLGNEYGMTGDEFWMEAESSPRMTEDYSRIMRLARSINMAKYLIGKNGDG